MKTTILLTHLLSFISWSSTSFAAEADNFTAKFLSIADVSGPVNQLANAYMAEAVEKLNKEGACDAVGAKEKLYVELRTYFGNHSKGKLVKEILYTENIAKNSLPLKESVYGDWKVYNGYLLGRKKAASSPLALSPLIQIGEHYIGVDKFEHMFGMGFIYFTQHYGKNKDIIKVLKSGIVKEKTVLGGNIFATGVFSYADLAANFNGMRFWNHMLMKNDDILGSEHNLGPYVVCENAEWKINQEIDFKNYIDASMDESVNCSKFANKSGERKFKKAIEAMKANCTGETPVMQELREKYKSHNIQHYILNDDGTGTVSYFNEF